MTIKSKEDWWKLAGETITLLPAYTSEFMHVDCNAMDRELYELYKFKDWKRLHRRFQEIWDRLPESSSIRVPPFFALCDLCSEIWVFEE